MTLSSELKRKPYGNIMIAILEDQGLMELLEGDIEGYFKNYRSMSPEIFSDFVKEMFLTDDRVSAIISENEYKSQYMAISLTDAYYLINSITGLCNQTIKRRLDDNNNIVTFQGKTIKSIMIRPKFNAEEIEKMKANITMAKVRINIDTIEDYDSEDIQVIIDEGYSN